MAAYRPMFAVLVLPVIVLAVLQTSPTWLRSGWGPPEFSSKNWKAHLAAPAAPAAEPSTPSPPRTAAPPQGEQPPSGTPPAPAAKPKTKAQFLAAELNGRLQFGTASALFQALALIAIVFAISQLRSNWRTGAPRPDNAAIPPQEQGVVVAVAIAVSVASLVYAHIQWSSDAVRGSLLFPPISAAAQELGTATAGLTKAIVGLDWYNYLIGYPAAGLLLAYLAALSIKSAAPLKEADRLVGLQFVLAIGAALFSAAVLSDKASIAFTTGVLDSKKVPEFIDALKTLSDVWAIAYSGFLITAIGTAYFAIRGSEATVTVQPANAEQDSLLALRTPDGKDFKFLGWLVNFVIAFAPVWVTQGIAKLLTFGTTALPS